MAVSAQTLHRRNHLDAFLEELDQLISDSSKRRIVAEFLSDPDFYTGTLPGSPELEEFLKTVAKSSAWEAYYASFG